MILAAADFGHFAPQSAANAFAALVACCLFSALQSSASVFFTPGWADFGSAARTLARFCHQLRCSGVAGNASRSSFQNPGCPQRSAEYREAALGGQLVEPLLHHAAHVRVDLVDVGILTELCADVDRCESAGRAKDRG